MNNIPTAEEYLTQVSLLEYSKKDYPIAELMIDFAKLHVEAALEAASIKIKTDALETFGTDIPDCWDEDSILNAYPLSNIK